MSYQIITDSCCDLTEAQYAEKKLSCVSLTVTYDGRSHSNFSNPDAVRAFYDGLRQGVTATTAAANPQDWDGKIRTVLEGGEDVLILAFSSGLSATCQSASLAARELGEQYPQRTVRVVDTRCASLGQGLLVWQACRKQGSGMSLEDLAAWVEETKEHICHWVTVDDLSHLKRGGRVSATTAIVGTMLNVKPIIRMDEQGSLQAVAKVRGRKTAMEYLVRKFEETAEDRDLVFIGHGDCPEDAAVLEAMLREKGADHVMTGQIGPVIGAHTGPGVLAVFFLGSHR